MFYIDASRYQSQAKRTGVEAYSYFLINELVRQHPKEICLITPRKIDLEVSQIVIPFPRLWTHVRLSWEIFKNRKINNLFVPSHVLPLFYAKKSVITIHDVAFKHSPDSYSWKSRYYLDWAAKFAVKHAYKIIVPSEKTRDDLITLYHCDKNKIKVIPLGFRPSVLKLNDNEAKKILEKHSLIEKKYFLYVGRIEHKKNSDTLVKAFGLFAAHHPDIKLVMAGFPGHGGREILDSIPVTLKDRIVLPGYISDEEKEILMKKTLCFVFPSREEGFGIPLLEAMNAGVPIIASNIPTSKEIAAQNALFFEPEDPFDLNKLMMQVSQTKDQNELKINHHKETLKQYSWQKCAEETYKIMTS